VFRTHSIAVARGPIKRRIFAIGFNFLRQHESENVPHTHTCTYAQSSHLSNLVDYFASRFFEGEHFSLSHAPNRTNATNHESTITSFHNHFNRSVPTSTIVASRSDPIEIIPIST